MLLAAFGWQRSGGDDTLVDLLIKMIQQIGVKAERRSKKRSSTRSSGSPTRPGCCATG